MAIGYAATLNGALRIETVSSTKIEAMKNALVTIFGQMVMTHHTENQIKTAYADCVLQSGNEHGIVMVEINVLPTTTDHIEIIRRASSAGQ